jgi:hypothetical protein
LGKRQRVVGFDDSGVGGGERLGAGTDCVVQPTRSASPRCARDMHFGRVPSVDLYQ